MRGRESEAAAPVGGGNRQSEGDQLRASLMTTRQKLSPSREQKLGFDGQKPLGKISSKMPALFEDPLSRTYSICVSTILRGRCLTFR